MNTTKCKIFSALGHPVRASLFQLVLARGAQTVQSLVALVGGQEPNVSHQLKVLKQAGLLVANKKGRFVFYRTADLPSNILDSLRSLLEYCDN